MTDTTIAVRVTADQRQMAERLAKTNFDGSFAKLFRHLLRHAMFDPASVELQPPAPPPVADPTVQEEIMAQRDHG